jgi:hypothetical protein
MKTRLLAVGVLLILIAAALCGGGYLLKRHKDDVAQQEQIAEVAAAADAMLAKYKALKDVDDKLATAMKQFHAEDDSFTAQQDAASSASQDRANLYHNPPVDPHVALQDVQLELEDVEQLEQLAKERANAARSVATALEPYYGMTTTNNLLSEITTAAEADGKYTADWWRAARQISDSLTAEVNGQNLNASENLGSLFQTSDEEEADSSAMGDDHGKNE